MFKEIVKRQPAAYRVGRVVVEGWRRHREAGRWTAPYLSPADKVAELRRYARQFGVDVFVETGTYEGETTYRLRRDFDHLFTVEIDPELARLARMVDELLSVVDRSRFETAVRDDILRVTPLS